jgi:hypothetical protein
MDKLSSNPFENPWMIFLCTFIDEIWFTFRAKKNKIVNKLHFMEEIKL